MAPAATLHALQKTLMSKLEIVSGLPIPAFVKMYKTCAPEEDAVKLTSLVLRCFSLFRAAANVSAAGNVPEGKAPAP